MLHPEARKRHGRMYFTLVELLVVVAIISVLAGILLPALSGALDVARKITCANNQKQIHTGVTLYTNDYAAWLPKWTTRDRNEFLYHVNIYLAQPMDLNQPEFERIASRSPQGLYYCPSITDVQSSPIWRGGSNTAAYYTPVYLPSSRQSWEAQDGIRGGWTRYTQANGLLIPHVKQSQIKNGSVFFGESNYATALSDGTVYYGNSIYTRYDHIQHPMDNWEWGWAWNHSNTINLTFKDGHVDSFSWTGERIMTNELEPLN